MKIASALESLEAGAMIRRESWGPISPHPGQPWIEMHITTTVDGRRISASISLMSHSMLPKYRQKFPIVKHGAWQPDSSDILGDDWVIILAETPGKPG